MSEKNINLTKINDYLVSFKTHKEDDLVYKIFEVKLPNDNIKWDVFDTSNIFVETLNNGNTYLILSTDPIISYNDIIKHIEKIIESNLNKEEKFILYKDKVDELNILFDTLNLSTLKSLKFKYKGQKNTPQKNIENNIEE